MTPAEALDYLHKNADSRNMIFNPARLKTALFTLGIHENYLDGENAELECFIRAVRCEVMRAQKLFPGRRLMGLAFNEEVGELNKALLDEPWKQVYKEAVQAATMAARVALEGDESVDQWRAGKGLDNPTHAE
ncbi:hypothetical protein Q5O_16995 [Pseudomonas putida JB]|uniref:hypothetical protein n=1 Tax=Pseudomonas putida TaxID=303 RepID=UPI000877FA03|nr:hypothetical protein [Pseudomonas putida]AOX10021.1 hypothetical protein Q5O_16995 [Pseudomonas putida JB]